MVEAYNFYKILQTSQTISNQTFKTNLRLGMSVACWLASRVLGFVSRSDHFPLIMCFRCHPSYKVLDEDFTGVDRKKPV